MSTFEDFLTCPNCGYKDAHYQQDNISCEVYEHCSQCGFTSQNGIVTRKGNATVHNIL